MRWRFHGCVVPYQTIFTLMAKKQQHFVVRDNDLTLHINANRTTHRKICTLCHTHAIYSIVIIQCVTNIYSLYAPRSYTCMHENEMRFNYCLHLRRHVVTMSVSKRFHIFIGVASEHVYSQVYINRFKWNK